MKNLFLTLFAVVLFIGFVPQISSAQNKSVWVAPKIGIWQLIGKDEENTEWTAQLRFTRKTTSKSITKYKGFFIWRSSNGEIVGREYFTGSFDKRTGKLRLKSYAVKNVSGSLAVGTYVGFVSRKGRRITRGSWDGNDVVKGTWSAEWLKFR